MDASVIIATYNRKSLLASCLSSMAEQEFNGSYEVLVVDDGSTDGTEGMVADFLHRYPVPLSYFRQKNQGEVAARNKGIAQARGEVIAFLDDDHVATKTWLQDICRSLEDRDVGGVSGRGRAVAGPELISKYLCFHRMHEAPQIEGGEVLYLVLGNSAFRREVVEKVGPLDAAFNAFFKGIAGGGGEDTEFSIRIRKMGYRLAYDPLAVTDHHQKTSFKGVMKERFNFGVNRVPWFFVEGRSISLFPVIGHIFWMIFSLINWPFHLWRYRKEGLSLLESIFFPVIDKVYEVVYHVGTLYGVVRIKGSVKAGVGGQERK